MSKIVKFSKVALGVAALSLSTSLWAGSTSNMMWDTMDDTMSSTSNMVNNFDILGLTGEHSGPVYIITDKVTGAMHEMDGIKCGHIVADDNHMVVDEDAVMGDRITDVRTNRSGIITGISKQGTMEVTHDNGKTVRYQYVTFKVKHE